MLIREWWGLLAVVGWQVDQADGAGETHGDEQQCDQAG